MSRIEWRRDDDRRPLLTIRLFRATPATDFDGVDAVALIDTGSTASGISDELADRLRLPKLGKRPLVSALGLEQAQRYMFRVGIDHSRDGPAFPFTFEPLMGFGIGRNKHFSALIGMDILRQCRFEIDHERCVLEFGI